jgi:uncharacterized protein (DUF4415 family)
VQKEERIVRYTAKELEAMVARGESLTHWDRVDAMTEEEIERLALQDEREHGPYDWSGPVYRGLPPGIGQPKKQLTVRFDADVVEWFKGQGKGYQTRMNAVLRQFMEHQRKQGE